MNINETKVDAAEVNANAPVDQHAPTGEADNAVAPVTGEADQHTAPDTGTAENPTHEADTASEGTGEGEHEGATPDVNLDDPALTDHARQMAAIADRENGDSEQPSQPVNVSAAKPVTLVPPTKGKGESKGAFKKRLAKWQADHPDYVAPAKQATPAKPVTTGKGEGDKPAAKPVTSTPAKVEPAPSPVSAAKPPKGKAGVKAALQSNPELIEGYDFSHMPHWLPFLPSREACMAVTALGVKTSLSKNHLAMAFYLEQAKPENRAVEQLVNAYDVGAAMVCVPLFASTKPDHKLNTATDHEREGYVIALPGIPAVPTKRLAGQKPQVVKAFTLTAKGLKRVAEYFKGRGETVPLWLSDPQAAMAEYEAAQAAAVIAADKAAKAAAKQAQRESRANA